MICKNKKKIIAIIASFFLIFSTACTVLLTNNANVEAASSSYKHNHAGYRCYKMSYYVSPSKCKQLARQTNKLNTVSAIANFIGLSGLTPGIISLVFGSAVSANNVFVTAARRGKGVQLNYIAHFSNTTTYNYSSNQNYVIK